MTSGMAHLAFVVRDMEKSLGFYCGVLGLTRILDLPDDEGRPWLIYLKVCDRQFIELFYNGSREYRRKDFEPTGAMHICLLTDDIQKLAEHLTDSGCILDIPPMRGSDGNWQCWVRDPDGNPIEFMQIGSDSPQAKAERAY